MITLKGSHFFLQFKKKDGSGGGKGGEVRGRG
jgi:hypothetical protein